MLSKYQMLHLTFVFQSLMTCSALVRSTESSSDQARQPTEYGWSRKICSEAYSRIDGSVSGYTKKKVIITPAGQETKRRDVPRSAI
jgi:hypothetical protein